MDTIDNITEDELVAALFLARTADESVEGALRTRDLVKMVGRSREWVRERLRPLVTEGRVEPVWIQIVDIAGRETKVPAYRLKEKDESSGTDILT